MARQLGGRRAAQLLTAFALLPAATGAGMLRQYVAFDYLCWVLTAYFVMPLLTSGNPRWWLAIGAAIGDGYSRAIRTPRGRVTLSHAQGLFPIMGQKFIAILKIILLLSAVSVPRAFAAVHPVPLEKNVDAAKCIECPRACDLHHNGLARQNTRHPSLVD